MTDQINDFIFDPLFNQKGHKNELILFWNEFIEKE